MKAAETPLLPFFDGKKQFIIPIYQRTYSWTRTQCEQLWNDIVRVSTGAEVGGHFVGSIVHIQQESALAGGIQQFLVIDGQQRMTTVSLLLLALAQVAESKKSADVSREDIYESYLINKVGRGDSRYKLILTQSDRDILMKLIETPDIAPTSQVVHKLLDNYLFFVQCIHESTLDLYTLYMGIINKLVIVEIALGREDKPQLIFESLNSTGVDLSEADLIRNYVLMGLPPQTQERLYYDYWYPMEQLFHGSDGDLFDRFMRDYLTLKQGIIPNINEVYRNFKAYHHDKSGLDIPALVKDIYRYALHYRNMALAYEPEVEIKRMMRDINALKVDVIYPFLLEVYDDYKRKLLSPADFLEILKLIENYLFRRAICGVPTSSLNKVFATLAHEIDKDNYLESIKIAFLSKKAGSRFPSDAEFRADFVVRDVYYFPRRNYLLGKLENYGRKEHVYIENYTIEHVMPQNRHFKLAWQQELGPNWQEVHAKYLHTIGNLTLTGYNPELSDRPFQEKRTMKGGFDHSPIGLNESLAYLDHWNEEEIKKRAELLADRAIAIWPMPTLADGSVIAAAKKHGNGQSNFTLNDYPHLTGEMLTLFEQLQQRILNLDASVYEECKKLYIAYKVDGNFVDVTPQTKGLRIWLYVPFAAIDDPKRLCKDVTEGRHGNAVFHLTSPDQVDDAMGLVRQSFEYHQDAVGV